MTQTWNPTRSLGPMVLVALTQVGFVRPEGVSPFPRLDPPGSHATAVSDRVLRPRLVPDAHTLGTQAGPRFERDSLSGAVRLIIHAYEIDGIARVPDSALGNEVDLRRSVIQIAQDVIVTHPEWFGTNQVYTLNESAVHISREDQFVSFDARVQGLLVVDAHVDFRFKYGRLLQVQNFSFSEAVPAPTGVAFRRHQATRRLAQAYGLQGVSFLGHVWRIGETEMGYERRAVSEFLVDREGIRYQLQYDVNSDELYEARTLAHYIDGAVSAEVFPRSWEDTPTTAALSQVDLKAGALTVRTDRNGRFALPETETSPPRLDGLTGSATRVVPASGTPITLVGSQDDRGWTLHYVRQNDVPSSSDKTMSQVMIYHHVNRVIQEASTHIHPEWFDRPLRGNANVAGSCNAFWDGSTINFYNAGSGCANIALSADIIFHEWGHGLDANTGGIADGAFSEGYGDIISMVMTGSNIVGKGFKTNGGGIRNLDPDKVYPDDQGEVHYEGQIIGSTFYDVLTKLRSIYNEQDARAILAKYAFKVIYTARRYTDVYQALLVIDDDDGDLTNKTPHYCLLNDTFAAHGLTQVDTTCRLGLQGRWTLHEDEGNGDGVFDPGEVLRASLTLRNTSSVLARNVRARLSTATTGVTIGHHDVHIESLAPGESSVFERIVEVVISTSVSCGQEILLQSEWSAESASPMTSSQAERVGSLQPAGSWTLHAEGLPRTIPDRATIDLPLRVTQNSPAAILSTLRANITLDHSRPSDLAVSLISPDGHRATLRDQADGNTTWTFADDVSSIFRDRRAQGDWILRIQDRYRRFGGSARSWSLAGDMMDYQCSNTAAVDAR